MIRILAALLALTFTAAAAEITTGEVGPVPAELRASLHLADFYQKHLDVGGLPILGSAQVSDAAMREAAWIVCRVLDGRADILTALAKNKVRLTVMAATEYTTDVPEHAHLTPRVYWDRRARGLGATPSAPCVSCAEENLLDFPGDPYADENILIHEFGHAIHETGLNTVDPTFDPRLKAAYDSAIAAGLWKGTYAGSNYKEYWAEGVQDWFDDNAKNNAQHNDINTRAKLREYDPALAALCQEIFGDKPWRYLRPRQRAEADRAHLAGFDFAHAPKFHWRAEPIPDKPLITIYTTEGEITVELDHRAAPRTVENFLRYVHEGFYNGGRFFRTVTAENQSADAVKIAVVQAEADPKKEAQAFPPIPLERTRDTGLRHLDGTISMARDTPDSATHNFFLCLGDQPALDFAGPRQPDGQGFAAFGRVTKGLDVVKKIHAREADGQTLRAPVFIQRIIRQN